MIVIMTVLFEKGTHMPDLPGFFRCACSKIHTRSMITQTTVCTCGKRLWPQMWGNRPAVKVTRVNNEPARLDLDDPQEIAVVDHLRGNNHDTTECAICVAERRTESIISGG